MKKKIIIITTAALMLGGSVGFAAASSPLIGAKVQGLFTVQKVDGTKIGDAVIINGSAYAPVRAISEATGTGLKVEGKKIIMESTTETTPSIGESTKAEAVDLDTKKASIEAEIAKKKANIADLETNVIPPLEALAKELKNNGTLGKQNQQMADDYKILVEKRKTELADLQKQLAEIDAQIAELQK
ncbi:hypothetical protein MKX34_17140 [Paenibacillus sp. FSL R5-0636]|uniref:hypothetical protein n=1 Tax=Paenibacillus TaxID=44249 RepID=UPI00096DB717|nr:hypothetical protein [Paenibacillus odorifer]OMD03492.1 hypothetical protein BJP49_01365 [Paenibacillus odorifer]